MAQETMKGQCPCCGKTIEWKGNLYRPFCSERCKLIDLGNWIAEEYRIVGENPASETKGEGRAGDGPLARGTE